MARVCLLAFIDDGTRDPTTGVLVSQSILDKSSDVLCLISMNVENESEILAIVLYAFWIRHDKAKAQTRIFSTFFS